MTAVDTGCALTRTLERAAHPLRPCPPSPPLPPSLRPCLPLFAPAYFSAPNYLSPPLPAFSPPAYLESSLSLPLPPP